MEGALGQHRQRQLEVEAEQADHEDEQDRLGEVGAVPDVSEAVGDPGLAGRLGDELGADQVGRVHQAEEHERRRTHRAGDQKHRPGVDGVDQEPGDRRTDHARAVERRRGQRERVGQQVTADHLGNERLPGRGLDRLDHAVDAGRDEDVPQAHHAGDDEQTQGAGDDRRPRVGNEQ